MASFEDICIVLDMCHKYIATALEERIVSHISCFFPCSLEQFLSSERDDRKRVAPFDYTSLECNARIANVARKTGALRLLPAALFRLCRHKPDQILRASLSPENLRAVLVGRGRLSATPAKRHTNICLTMLPTGPTAAKQHVRRLRCGLSMRTAGLIRCSLGRSAARLLACVNSACRGLYSPTTRVVHVPGRSCQSSSHSRSGRPSFLETGCQRS